MRSFGRWLGRLLAFTIATLAAIWFLAPREEMDPALSFDASVLPDDLDVWLAQREQTIPDIRADSAKSIVWAGAPGARTPWALVYIHGFSADRQEVRPLPDLVAQGLGANLYFARLSGHGRTGEAMAQATPEDWMTDMAEALAIGRRLGDRVLLMGTSTGGTLITLAQAQPGGAEGVAGAVMISPNYRLASAVSGTILDLPLARHWAPLVAGAERSFAPLNEGHARHWTTRYPTAALFPLATLMRTTRALDFGAITTPALFVQAPGDLVVSAEETARVATAWGGPARLHAPELTPQDDPYAHVIAGEILSPNQTAPLAALVLDWAAGL